MNMLNMERDTPSIPLDRLSGSKTQLMIGPSKLVENKGSAPLMAMPCHWLAEAVRELDLAMCFPTFER